MNVFFLHRVPAERGTEWSLNTRCCLDAETNIAGIVGREAIEMEGSNRFLCTTAVSLETPVLYIQRSIRRKPESNRKRSEFASLALLPVLVNVL